MLFLSLILASQLSLATEFDPELYPHNEVKVQDLKGLKELVRAIDSLLIPDDVRGQLIRAVVPGYTRQYFQFEDSAKTDNLQLAMRQSFLRKTGRSVEVHAFNVGTVTYLFPSVDRVSVASEVAALLFELGLQQIRNDNLKLVAKGKRAFISWLDAGQPSFHDFHIFLAEFFNNTSVELMAASVADLKEGRLKGLVKKTRLVFPLGSQATQRLPGKDRCLLLEDIYPFHIYSQNNPDMLRNYHFELQKRFPKSHLIRLLADRVQIMEVFVRPAREDKWKSTCLKTWDVIPYEGPSAYKKIRVFPTVTSGSDTRFEVGLVLEPVSPGVRGQYGLRPNGYSDGPQ